MEISAKSKFEVGDKVFAVYNKCTTTESPCGSWHCRKEVYEDVVEEMTINEVHFSITYPLELGFRAGFIYSVSNEQISCGLKEDALFGSKEEAELALQNKRK